MWRRFVFSPAQQQQHRKSSSNSTPPSSSMDYSSFDYCVDLVRQRDRESYLCTLLLPAQNRLAAFAIRALNVELASVRTMVSNQNTALMRFQFWTSALEKIYGSSRKNKGPSAIPDHPVARALSNVVEEKKLSRKWFSEMIESRIERVDDRRSFQTIKELEDFYQRTFGAVLFLLLESDQVRNVHADHAASHLAKALGLVNGLRAIHANPERNVHILPLELLLHHRVSQHDFVRSAMLKKRGRQLSVEEKSDLQQRLRDLTFDLASQAHVHLDQCRKLKEENFGNKKESKKQYDATRLVLLPAAIVDHQLNVLRKIDFDITDQKFGLSHTRLAFTLWWRKLLKTY